MITAVPLIIFLRKYNKSASVIENSFKTCKFYLGLFYTCTDYVVISLSVYWSSSCVCRSSQLPVGVHRSPQVALPARGERPLHLHPQRPSRAGLREAAQAVRGGGQPVWQLWQWRHPGHQCGPCLLNGWQEITKMLLWSHPGHNVDPVLY